MNLRPLALLLASSLLAACGGSTSQDSSSADDLRHRHHDGGTGHHDGGTGHHDGGTGGHDGGIGANDGGIGPGGACAVNDDCSNGDLCTAGACVASACNQRHSGVSGIRATFRVDQYLGLIQGRNGTHELADGTLQNVIWMYQPSLEDTASARVAMNVASSTDPQGLPYEVPLRSGEVIEFEGEYIPAATANAGGRAVIHYTHGSCGYVTINGVTY